jgi:hypothetical protein
MNKVLDGLFNEIYRGNVHAVALSHQLWDISQTWDDLIDGDRVTAEEINNAFINALVNVSTNPLWGADIAANVLNVYLRWSDANYLEADPESTKDDLAKAWMLRAGLYDIFVLLAAKLYGISWANTIGPMVRRTYGETLEDFLQEMQNA